MSSGKDSQWWRKPIRMIRYDPLNDFTRFLKGDLEQHAEEVRRVCHANCEWIMANGGSSPGTADIVNFDSPHFDKNPTLGDRDILRDYLPAARSQGIHVIAYVNLHWFSYDFASKHPGWEQMQADGVAYGRAHPLYGNGTTMCVNSAWRDFAFLLLSESMRTGIDGVFLDGPVVYPDSCYCDSCLELYRKDFGKEPPREEDWSEDWKIWIDFRERSMKRFLGDARTAVRAVNQEGVVFCNAGGWQLTTRVARHPWRLESEQDFTGAEVFVHYGVPHEDWLDTTIMAKFLSAGENPAVVFSDHAMGGWHYVGMPGPELNREFYQTIAGGANPWIAVFTPALDHQRAKTLDVVEEGWSFIESVEPFIAADTPAARIAVLRSDATALHYLSQVETLRTGVGAAREEDLIASVSRRTVEDRVAFKRTCESQSAEEFRGWCYMLTRQHLPFVVIRDQDVTAEGLVDYDCVILPNSACLSDIAIHALEGFQSAGGVVVSTFESGWYDDKGGLRPPGTGGAGLGRPDALAAFDPATFEEYALIESAQGDLPGFDRDELVPRPEHALQVPEPEDAQVLARYLEPVGFHYRLPQGLSPHSMALTGTSGQGSWLYFACAPGAEWMRFRVPHWERLVGSAIRRLLGDRCQVSTDAPPTVQIELRRQPGRTIIHVVNNTSDNEFPFGTVIPLGEVTIGLRSVKPRSVRHADGTDVPFEYTDGVVTISVDMSEQYRLLVLSE